MGDKTTIRLSREDRRLIDLIRNKLRISQSDIIRLAIRRLAEIEGVGKNSGN